jgi:hypothetical protein
VLSRRFAQNYRRLSSLVLPKVHAACWRAAWNGWCVDYRFRNLEKRSWTKPCVFKCSSSAEDRIEHYCHCVHVRAFANRYLGLASEPCTLARFLCCDKDMSDTSLTLTALLVYSVYMAFNHVRHNGFQSDAHLFDMLEQHCKLAVCNHPASQRVLYAARQGYFSNRT